MVKDENGRWCEEEDEIVDCFVKFYQRLFKTNGTRDWGVVLENVPLLVSDEMNKELDKEVKDEEITEVVFQMGMYKAPRPDGFSGVFFFHKFWNIVRVFQW